MKRAALALCLFIMLLASIMSLSQSCFVLANAEASIPKPSVPEFTLDYVDTSYDVPSRTTTTTDPYTGEQTITIEPGYHVKNGTIEVTIKNQEFTPYPIDSQHTISLFYYVSYKGHYAEGWDYYPPSTYGREYSAIFIRQSTSDYTVVQFRAPSEGEMDFRVQAQIGYYTSTTEFIAVPGAPFTTYTFNGEVSGWSSTQTVTIPPPSSSSSGSSPQISPSDQTTEPAPKETQQTFQLDVKIELFPTVPVEVAAVATVIVVVVVFAGLLVLFKKRKREANPS